jgi:hypothetical protein
MVPQEAAVPWAFACAQRQILPVAFAGTTHGLATNDDA